MSVRVNDKRQTKEISSLWKLEDVENVENLKLKKNSTEINGA